VTVFLSYSSSDERFASQIANRLLSSGHEIWTFEYGELTEGPYDFLKECRACAVIYSANSRTTDAVRLSRHLTRYETISWVMADENWDPDPQARLVFERFRMERTVFEVDTVFRRMLRVFSDVIAAGFSLGDTPANLPGNGHPYVERSARLVEAARTLGLIEYSTPSGIDWDMAKPPPKRAPKKAKPLRKVLSGFPDSQLLKGDKRRVRASLRKAARPPD
jgi:hypothetical protein